MQMEPWEALECVTNINYIDRTERELWRYELFILCQSNSKKKLNPKDILSLPWDDNHNTENQKVSQEQREKLQKAAEEMRKKLFEKAPTNTSNNE